MNPIIKFKGYRTSHYTIYNITTPQPLLERVAEAFKGFQQYDHYLLYCSPNLKSFDDMPKEGVRVDDLTISKLYEWKIKAVVLHESFPADFDRQGMVRATRVPLGNVAKVWKQKGEKDIENRGKLKIRLILHLV